MIVFARSRDVLAAVGSAFEDRKARPVDWCVACFRQTGEGEIVLGTLLVPCLVALSVDRTRISPQSSTAQWEKDCGVKSAMEVRVLVE